MVRETNQSGRSQRVFGAFSIMLVHLLLMLRASMLYLTPQSDDAKLKITQSNAPPYSLLDQPIPTALDQIYNRSIPLISETTNSSSRVVSVAFANANYLEKRMLQNLVCSFHKSNITNYVIIVMDEQAAELAARANITHVHFDRKYWKGVRPSKLRKGNRVTNRYARMIQLRTNFIRSLLHTYKELDIVTTDADTTWTTRPWETIPFGRGETNCSIFLENSLEDGRKTSGSKEFRPSCGFLMLHNCEATRRLYDIWLEKEVSGGEKEQPTLTRVLRRNIGHNVTLNTTIWQDSGPWDQDKLHLCALSRERYPGYKYLFQNRYVRRHKNRKNVVVFHPNSGDKGKKVRLFRLMNQWLLRNDGSCPYV